LSLLPLGGEAHGIHTTNLAYPLEDEDLPFGPARGVSNLLTAEVATVSLKSGTLIAVWTPGRA
jgi:thiamine pyrophosphokinase